MLRDADEGIGVPVVKALDMRIEHERDLYSCRACKDLANGAWIMLKSFVLSRRIPRKTLAFESDPISDRFFIPKVYFVVSPLDYRFFIFFRETRIFYFPRLKRVAKMNR